MKFLTPQEQRVLWLLLALLLTGLIVKYHRERHPVTSHPAAQGGAMPAHPLPTHGYAG